MTWLTQPGLTAVTLDKEFAASRKASQRRNRPRHALYGLSSGASRFGSALASGVEGLVQKPIDGAEKDVRFDPVIELTAQGAAGFLKGVGRGLIGLPTKTLVGFFDAASTVSEGVRCAVLFFFFFIGLSPPCRLDCLASSRPTASSARTTIARHWVRPRSLDATR